MPVNRKTTAEMKLYIDKDIKNELEAVSHQLGQSLSSMAVQALINEYLPTRGVQKNQQQPVIIQPAQPPNNDIQGVLEGILSALKGIALRLDALEATQPVPPPALSDQCPNELTIDQLAVRLGMDKRTGKSTLSTLGGRWDSLDRAKILKITAEHDPQGLSWLPTDSNRRTWQRPSL